MGSGDTTVDKTDSVLTPESPHSGRRHTKQPVTQVIDYSPGKYCEGEIKGALKVRGRAELRLEVAGEQRMSLFTFLISLPLPHPTWVPLWGLEKNEREPYGERLIALCALFIHSFSRYFLKHIYGPWC